MTVSLRRFAMALMAIVVVLVCNTRTAKGLVPPTPRLTKQHSSLSFLHPSVTSTYRPTTTRLYELEEQKKGFFETILDPYPTKIPKEMREEINVAEGNTIAGKERKKRITIYGVAAVLLVCVAMFNAFLTELRDTVDPDTISKFNELVPANEAVTDKISLSDFGFGWVESNPVFRFLFITKIGGGGALVTGAVLGLLVEAELDSKRANAEKIWEEIERRRSGRPKAKPAAQTVSAATTSAELPKPKKQSKKEKKRLAALTELMVEEPVAEAASTKKPAAEEQEAEPEEKKDGGIMGKFKEFYDKADSMAASQALLLNKELEDRGVVEKITDDTGLKVIGKEAAAKLQAEKDKEDKEGDG